MRSHPDEIARYADVKRSALAEGRTTPWAYQQAKTPYLVELAQQNQGQPTELVTTTC
jgi:GrpB-like predicted nucleotidyltransferase (UPF0157 family)